MTDIERERLVREVLDLTKEKKRKMEAGTQAQMQAAQNESSIFFLTLALELFSRN